jgi:hypothetical protein
MGTNFYLAGKHEGADDMDPRWHIGKRFAAGLWCWDCGVPVANSRGECLECGRIFIGEDLLMSAGGRELGFNRSAFTGRKGRGITGCMGFIWCMPPEIAGALKSVRDEYGRKMSGDQFRRMIKEVRVHEYSIGREFL